MRYLGPRVVGSVLALLVVVACSDGGTVSAGPAPSASAPTTGATTTPASPTSTAPSPSGSCTPATAEGATAGVDTGIAVLQAIRIAQHEGYDRVVLEFDKTPGHAVVRYVDRVTEDPSDRPVALDGTAFVEVVVQGAAVEWAAVQTGPGQPVRRYTGPTDVRCTLPVVRQLKLSGDFEAVLSFGIGLEHKASVTTTTLSDPGRLVLDFQHA
ncbi:MAG: hypothetical protein M3P23_14515 [Actinomycetota bacterium]|nr:hypothetical protein [Actinomycetota bacterium]